MIDPDDQTLPAEFGAELYTKTKVRVPHFTARIIRENEYRPWEAEGVTEADYWRERYRRVSEAQEMTRRLEDMNVADVRIYRVYQEVRCCRECRCKVFATRESDIYTSRLICDRKGWDIVNVETIPDWCPLPKKEAPQSRPCGGGK